MTGLEQYSTELVEKEGILFAKTQSAISYPEEGNENYFQIEENSFWFSHRNNCIISAVKKYSPDKFFFDIGGGNGYVAKGLEESGIKTVLVEPGLQGCINAKKRNLKHVVCSTLEDASFKKNAISAIGLFDVVEHIEDDIRFLASIHSYLEKDGLVFITVPAFNALWSNEDKDAGHYRRYSVRQMEEKLKSVGFAIEYSTYIFSILPLPVFLFRSLPSRLGFNKNSGSVDKHKNEHKKRNGLTEKILNKVWSFELNRIKKGKKIGIGGSCFVIARKRTA